jgi:hypothetical protein
VSRATRVRGPKAEVRVLQVAAEARVAEVAEPADPADLGSGRPLEATQILIRDDFLIFSIHTALPQDEEILELRQYGCSCTGREKSPVVYSRRKMEARKIVQRPGNFQAMKCKANRREQERNSHFRCGIRLFLFRDLF